MLNRIGFGARPGDVERVQQMGLAAYIEQQLHPERIADAALTRGWRIRDAVDEHAELAEKYFVPADELRRDQQLQAGAKREAQAASRTSDDDDDGAASRPRVRNEPLDARAAAGPAGGSRTSSTS